MLSNPSEPAVEYRGTERESQVAGISDAGLQKVGYLRVVCDCPLDLNVVVVHPFISAAALNVW